MSLSIKNPTQFKDTTQYTVGIDPGLDGALVVMANKRVVTMDNMPTIGSGKRVVDETGLVAWACKWLPLEGIPPIVCLEKSQAMPKQGGVSMFNYGMGYGMLRLLVVSRHVVVHHTGPKVWQKEMYKGIETKLGPKEKAEIAVNNMFPNLELPKCNKKKMEGIRDALLMAEYARRFLQ